MKNARSSRFLACGMLLSAVIGGNGPELPLPHPERGCPKTCLPDFPAMGIGAEAIISHQVFIHLKRYDPARSFRTWVFSITYKRCLDMLRRRKYARRLAQVWPTGTGSTAAGLVEDVAFMDNEVKAAINCLNGPERTALHLRLTEDRTAREIAEVIGCSEATARVHLFHAKRKLKRILGKDNHVPN